MVYLYTDDLYTIFIIPTHYKLYHEYLSSESQNFQSKENVKDYLVQLSYFRCL